MSATMSLKMPSSQQFIERLRQEHRTSTAQAESSRRSLHERDNPVSGSEINGVGRLKHRARSLGQIVAQLEPFDFGTARLPDGPRRDWINQLSGEQRSLVKQAIRLVHAIRQRYWERELASTWGRAGAGCK